MLKLSGHKNMA